MAVKPKKPLISVVMKLLGVGFLGAAVVSVAYFYVGNAVLAAYAFPAILTCFVAAVMLVGFSVVIELLNEIRWYLRAAHGGEAAAKERGSGE